MIIGKNKKQKEKRIQVILPFDVHRTIKNHVLLHGHTISSWVTEALISKLIAERSHK